MCYVLVLVVVLIVALLISILKYKSLSVVVYCELKFWNFALALVRVTYTTLGFRIATRHPTRYKVSMRQAMVL